MVSFIQFTTISFPIIFKYHLELLVSHSSISIFIKVLLNVSSALQWIKALAFALRELRAILRGEGGKETGGFTAIFRAFKG